MEKNQFNKEGKREGYWELHWDNGKLASKGYYINGERVGFWEFDYSDGEPMFKKYFFVK
jgi:antitoxin component YwqK of YwqJK toxin-antitoxin module